MYYTTPSSNIEANIQAVGQIYASALASGSFPSSANISALESIANKCPYTDGIGVYQARTLVDYYTGKITIYNDEGCISHSTHKAIKRKNNKETDTLSSVSVDIYPNPNNGNFTIAYQLKNGQTGILEIFDAIGEKVGEYTLPNVSGIMLVSNPNLRNGVYVYKVIANDNSVKVGRIVIIK